MPCDTAESAQTRRPRRPGLSQDAARHYRGRSIRFGQREPHRPSELHLPHTEQRRGGAQIPGILRPGGPNRTEHPGGDQDRFRQRTHGPLHRRGEAGPREGTGWGPSWTPSTSPCPSLSPATGRAWAATTTRPSCGSATTGWSRRAGRLWRGRWRCSGPRRTC